MIFVRVILIALLLTSIIAIFQFAALIHDGAIFVSRLRICLAFWIPILIAKRASKKKSLDLLGSIAAVFVGAVMMLHSYAHVAAMITFFFTSTTFTKFRRERKRKLETSSSGDTRNWKQVIANGGIASLFALLAFIRIAEPRVLGGERRLRMIKWKGHHDFEFLLSYDLSILGSIVCATGDTWASEIGAAIGDSEPRLFPSFRKVPRGTNGAISTIGTLSSIIGGGVVGLAYCFTITLLAPVQNDSLPQWILIIVCMLCGLIGSLVDSLIGTNFQYSGLDTKTQCIVQEPGPTVQHISGRAILDNDDVNLLSSFIISLVTPTITRIICLYFI